MLTLYNYIEAIMQEHNGRQWYFETKLNYFASDILEMLNVTDFEEQQLSINRALKVFKTLQIPFPKNFKRVYRYDGERLFIDWKISPLACYLITINSDPVHENVAKAQMFFAMNQPSTK